MPEEPVTLVSIGQGALVELFDIELERVLKNIADPNTDARSTRVITLKVTIKPDEERTMGSVGLSATSKVASSKPTATVVYMGRKQGQLVAVESNPSQSSLFDAPKPVPVPASVSPISREERQ